MAALLRAFNPEQPTRAIHSKRFDRLRMSLNALGLRIRYLTGTFTAVANHFAICVEFALSTALRAFVAEQLAGVAANGARDLVIE